MSKTSVIILAAGRSKRMFTDTPKVLHKVANIPLIDRVLKAVTYIEPASIHMVVGYEKEQIVSHVGDRVIYSEQKELLGTGHAVMQAMPNLKDEDEVMVICGDMPLLTGELLDAFLKSHRASGKKLSLMSAIVPWHTDFGRIIRNDEGKIVAIREDRDASPEEKKIKEVNLALYIVNRDILEQFLPTISSANAQKEYYFTDIISNAFMQGYEINGYICEDPYISRGVNSRKDLAELNEIVRTRVNEAWMAKGVTFIDPKNSYIDEDVQIGRDTVIHPATFIENGSVIGARCEIGPSSRVVASQVGDNVLLQNSIVLSSKISSGCKIGPFSYIRPDTELSENVKIGDFTELKKSKVGKNSKIPHLSYVGDAVVGENVNIGAGTITCNYDGKNKHKTEIGSGTRIGSNTNLVAPVKVGENVVTGAGAVVTHDVPDGAIAYGVPARVK